MAAATKMSLIDSSLLMKLVDRLTAAIPKDDPVHKEISRNEEAMQQTLQASIKPERKVQLYNHHLHKFL